MNAATPLEDAQHARHRVVLLRWSSLAPLILMAAFVALSPQWRDAFADGWTCLREGNVEGLREIGARLGASAVLFTTLLMIAQALAVPIPAVVVTAANSLLFGPFLGAWLSIASATLAALMCFALARAWGEPLIAHLVPAPTLARANTLMESHGASAVLAARLMPFVPFDPISYIAGLSRMRTWTFVWATFVGQLPAGFAYSYLAQEVDQPLHLVWKIGLSLVGLTLLAWAGRRALTSRAAKS